MEWNFKMDYRLLLFPSFLLLLTVGLFFYEPFNRSFRLMFVAWALFFFGYFYLLHVKKILNSSVLKLRFSDDVFQIFHNGEWLPVSLENGSLISYWMLALQWKVTDDVRPILRQSFSLVVRPGSMNESEFRALMRALNQL